MQKFIVVIEKDSDGTYIAYNTNVDGYVLLGRGNTVAESKADFENSMKEVAESVMERKGSIPKVLTTPPAYKFSLASFFEYYSVLNVSALGRLVGINDSLMRKYKKGETYISEAQLLKIETAVNKLGKEFAAVRFV